MSLHHAFQAELQCELQIGGDTGCRGSVGEQNTLKGIRCKSTLVTMDGRGQLTLDTNQRGAIQGTPVQDNQKYVVQGRRSHDESIRQGIKQCPGFS